MKRFRTIIIYTIGAFLLFSLVKNLIDYRGKLSFYNSFKKEYEAEKKKNISLNTQYLLENDPAEIEKTIRNKLNLVKPGETEIIIPQPTPTVFVPTPTPEPNWHQWLNLAIREPNFR